jgi:hypothetical protein
LRGGGPGGATREGSPDPTRHPCMRNATDRINQSPKVPPVPTLSSSPLAMSRMATTTAWCRPLVVSRTLTNLQLAAPRGILGTTPLETFGEGGRLSGACADCTQAKQQA